jgi:large subunit ribosomal protein L3
MFIIGRKLEMSQRFKDDGTVVPVTLVRVQPNVVTQVRTQETDGYVAVQIGTGEKVKGHTKPEAGHLKDLPQMRVLREFRVADAGAFKRGDALDLNAFQPGMKVDVVGTSKGHGFQGVVKRHHFAGGKATHGQKDQMRMPGSLASQRQGPVSKGQRMAGHMGDVRVTVKNLEVVSIDAASNTIAIKGAVPGARNGLLLITASEGKSVWQR